jgi:hypothetical protein
VIAGLVFAVGLIASGLVRLRGQTGTSIAFLFFLTVANPASGLATAPDLLPTPFRQAGPFMPPGAAGQAIRGSAYFGGAADLAPILILLAWVGLGLGLNLLASQRTAAAHSPQPETVSTPAGGGARLERLIGQRRQGAGRGVGRERTWR